MGHGFDGQAEQDERQTSETMNARSGLGFLGGETKEQRQVSDRTRGELLLVKREQVSQVARRERILQSKFGKRLGEGAGEAGRLSHRGEIGQGIGGCGGVNDARGECFDAQAGNGSKPEASQGLRGEMGRELRESERVNALAARRKGMGSELIRCGSGGGDHQDFRVLGLFGQEGGSALEKRGVGAGVQERAREHT